MEKMPLTDGERSLRGQIGAHTSWANTSDRSARTKNARKGFEDKFLAEAYLAPSRYDMSAEQLKSLVHGRQKPDVVFDDHR